MSAKSGIEWTEATWNPVTGCTKVSPGCKHCYAEQFAMRLQKTGQPRYKNGFAVTTHPDLVELPLTWKQPRLVFVDSMGDLFHEEVPFEFIVHVFSTIEKAKHHTFQVLTKRAERLALLATKLPWPDNLWIGTSVESQGYMARVKHLQAVPGRVKFLSLEPLLGPLTLPLQGIDWVIVGGESGTRARPVRAEWVRQLRDQCLSSEIPFFFKQWGGRNKKVSGRLLDGRFWDEMPRRPLMEPVEVVQVQPEAQFPDAVVSHS